MTLLTADQRPIKVRLAEIDAPESGQPYGSRAKQALANLAFGRPARVQVVDRDRYGRVVGRVHADGLDVNAELVRQGAVWVYRQYARDSGLFALEEEARQHRRGLWALSEAQKIPPWEWRKAERRSVIKTSPASETGSAALACGSKRTCQDMTSCAEAKFYLDVCGLLRLDSDNDGVPCEALCR